MSVGRINERVLNNGLDVDIGDRVRWACIYDDTTTDAEIVETGTGQVRISERPNFVDGQDYFAHITDSVGGVHGPYTVTQGSNGDSWVAGVDQENLFLANNRSAQAGSRILIGTAADLNYYDFVVTGKNSI